MGGLTEKSNRHDSTRKRLRSPEKKLKKVDGGRKKGLISANFRD